MYKDIKQLKCGSCGNENFHVFQEKENNQRIISVCTNCKSQTEITIRPAEIKFNFGENSEGILCNLD